MTVGVPVSSPSGQAVCLNGAVVCSRGITSKIESERLSYTLSRLKFTASGSGSEAKEKVVVLAIPLNKGAGGTGVFNGRFVERNLGNQTNRVADGDLRLTNENVCRVVIAQRLSLDRIPVGRINIQVSGILVERAIGGLSVRALKTNLREVHRFEAEITAQKTVDKRAPVDGCTREQSICISLGSNLVAGGEIVVKEHSVVGNLAESRQRGYQNSCGRYEKHSLKHVSIPVGVNCGRHDRLGGVRISTRHSPRSN